MEIQKIQNNKQKLVITYLITSDKLISDLFPILQEHKKIIYQSFTGFYRIVLEWCLDYYEKYHKASNIHIQNIYNEKKQQLKEEDQKLLETFLQNLSDKYEEQNYNEKYILDLSLTYLREINLNVLQKQIDEFKTLNRIDDAEHLVLTYNKFDTQTEIKQETFLFKDLEYACKVCDNSLNTDEDDKLFKLKGDLGNKLGWIYREDFFSLVAPAKRGKCLTENSEILFKDGSLIKIKDIIENKINKQIISLNENIYKLEKDNIVNYFDLGKKECLRITTKTGREIECATTHPFLHFSNGWVESKDLKEKDFIACPRKINYFGNKELEDYKIKLLAYLLADGCLVGSSFTFCKKEKEVKDDFRRCVIQFGDIYRRIDELGDAIISSNGKKRTNIKKFFDEYKIKKCKSIYKEIPDIIFNLKKEQISLFLNILFTCDGSIWKDRNGVIVEYSSGSKRMIYQIQSLLLRFGIISKIKPIKVKNLEHTYYSLSFQDKENLLLFLDEIDFSFSKKERSDNLKELLYAKRDNFSFINIFPYEMKENAFNEIKKYRSKNNISYEEICKYKIINNFLSDKYRKNGLKKFTIFEINKIIKSDVLNKYLNADIFWDQIEKIESIGKVQCYDIEVEKNHNYIANNFITHNSFYLREIALICAEQGLNVIVFNLEESHKKYCKSFYQNISSEIKDKPESFKNIKIPYFEKNANDKYDIKYDELKKFGLNSRKIKGIFRKQKIKTKGDIIVRSFPSNTLTFQKMSKCLDEYALQGYVVDILLIDFLDNLKSFNKNEHRHSIDEKWTNTRRLAQEKHIAIGTVSHTKKENFKKDIEMGSPNEDYRKENHITQMIGINQTPEEKKKQVARLNIFHNRENDCSSKEFFVCLECRDLGKVLVDNMNLYKVNYNIKKEK